MRRVGADLRSVLGRIGADNARCPAAGDAGATCLRRTHFRFAQRGGKVCNLLRVQHNLALGKPTNTLAPGLLVQLKPVTDHHYWQARRQRGNLQLPRGLL